jgi:PAS domain S-box-containing protein
VSKIVGGRPPAECESLSRDRAAQHYAAIVESSDDAILSKDLNGVITSWNTGAQRLFGYTAEEAVGRSVTLIIPTDRHDEEPMILERVRRGERIDHCETVRQRKDGSLVDISITVSPIKDEKGEIVGASKIARDIAQFTRAPESGKIFCLGGWIIGSRICSHWRSAF